MFFRPPSRKVGTNHAETHLRSDNITTIYLLCCFDAPQHTSFPHAMADIQKGGIHASLSSIFKSEKYSDLIIRCGDRVFKVHRAIVCPRSHFFSAACDGPFQASGGSIHQARLTFILHHVHHLDQNPGVLVFNLCICHTGDSAKLSVCYRCLSLAF